MRNLALLSLLLLGTNALGCSSTPDPALIDLAGCYAKGFGPDTKLVQALVWVESKVGDVARHRCVPPFAET